MFIVTEPTPNPDTLKFIPGCQVTPNSKIFDFPDPNDCAISPLAGRLFTVKGVRSIMLAADFIAISKHNDQDWNHLKPAIFEAIIDHFVAGRLIIDESMLKPAPQGEDANMQEHDQTIKQIKAILAERVQPAVARDGGYIEFVSFEKGILYLRMQGACSGCPSASVTLKQGIENMMRHFLPEVLEVRACEDEMAREPHV